MDLVLACNWDDELIEAARRFHVRELFGKLQQDPVGGGRVAFILPRIERKRAAAYIGKVQDAGIEFNYLLNGTCMGLHEFTRSGHSRFHDFLDWLWDSSVRVFTVSIPYVAAMIKSRYPEARLVVSMMAQVDSVERARYWEGEGAETLILFDNKDFPLLRALKRHTNLKLEIPANLSCMNRCHQTFYHGNVASHSSNPSGLGLYSLPVCETRCMMMKVLEPARLLAGQWVRPQDLGLYEAIGLDRVKVLDRISPTPQLIRILEAYATRKFDGNLAELIPGYRQDRLPAYFEPGRALDMLSAFLRPGTYNVFKALPFARRNRPPAIRIETSALDGFLEGVMARDCRHTACESCGWCAKFAHDAVSMDSGEVRRFLADCRTNLDELESGRFFTYVGREEGR